MPDCHTTGVRGFPSGIATVPICKTGLEICKATCFFGGIGKSDTCVVIYSSDQTFLGGFEFEDEYVNEFKAMFEMVQGKNQGTRNGYLIV